MHFTNVKFPEKEKNKGKARVVDICDPNTRIGQSVWLQQSLKEPLEYIVTMKGGVRTAIPEKEFKALGLIPKTASTAWRSGVMQKRREKIADSFADYCSGVR